jgi:hypothetical protein
VGRAGPVLGLRCGQRALRAAWLRERQSCRPLQEGSASRQAAARLCPTGRPLELIGDLVVGRGSGLRAVPCPAIGIDLGIGRRCERPVGGPALRGRCWLVDRGARQRMTKPDHRAELDQTGGLGGRRRVDRDPELGDRAPQQRRVPDRIRRRDQQEPLCIRRERVQPPPEALLDPPRQRRCVGQSEPARQLRGGQPSRQLQQSQRIAARLGHDPISHPLVQRRRDDGAQECASIGGAQAVHFEIGQPGQLRESAGLAHGEDDRHRLGQEAPRHERQRLHRGSIEPMRIVDHAHQRPLVGHVAQEAQHRQIDEEATRDRTHAQSEGRA